MAQWRLDAGTWKPPRPDSDAWRERRERAERLAAAYLADGEARRG